MYIFILHTCSCGYKTISRFSNNRNEDTNDFIFALSKDTKKKLLCYH